MAWAYPATGETITFKVKKSTAPNGGRMKGDDLIKEMFNIMLPVAELKTMMSDEVDAWIAKMAEYGQEWCTPDGRLLKCTDYPELFALIGYNYGWSSTNPNGTSTYSFTDNNGNSKSLVIYNDLDIDGNSLPVPEGTSPLYFRIPNLAGRFLRCAGEATYINKWTDTDGTVRQLLTEYKAEMYKGQLDAQRGISGRYETSNDLQSLPPSFYTGSGCIQNLAFNEVYPSAQISSGKEQKSNGFKIDNGLVIPIDKTNRPLSFSMTCLLRIT